MKPNMGLNSGVTVNFAASWTSKFLVLVIYPDVVLHFTNGREFHVAFDSCQIGVSVFNYPGTNELFLTVFHNLIASLFSMNFMMVKFLLIVLEFKATNLALIKAITFDVNLMPSFVES